MKVKQINKIKFKQLKIIKVKVIELSDLFPPYKFTKIEIAHRLQIFLTSISFIFFSQHKIKYTEDCLWDSKENLKEKNLSCSVWYSVTRVYRKQSKIFLEKKLLWLCPRAHRSVLKIQGNRKEQQGIQVFM